MIESPVAPSPINPVTITGTGLLKTIELKKGIFYLTELTEEQKNFIILHKSQKTLDIASESLGIDCNSIVLIGSTTKINTFNTGKYIGSFEGPDTGTVSNSNNPYGDRQIHFREFSYTLERQIKSSWLINVCPDLRMSVNSLKRVINSEYCCIWKKRN